MLKLKHQLTQSQIWFFNSKLAKVAQREVMQMYSRAKGFSKLWSWGGLLFWGCPCSHTHFITWVDFMKKKKGSWEECKVLGPWVYVCAVSKNIFCCRFLVRMTSLCFFFFFGHSHSTELCFVCCCCCLLRNVVVGSFSHVRIYSLPVLLLLFLKWKYFSWCTPVPLITAGSVHIGWASWDNSERVFPDELPVSLFPW